MADAVLDMLNANARSIRDEVPIAGSTATEREVVARDALARGTLGSTLVDDGARENRWYTCRLADGRVVGRWSNSWAEAVLYTAMWTGVDVVRCVLDPDGSLHNAERTTRGTGVLFDLLDLADEGER
ncbi:hypothetical protein [Leifsonia virtsii]|uniref:Uncharacterized protein n=1 Tax=Leifsonia virtsii TaxID=3035915 RepID=A0ABT8J175_9MICO|nr:hypothetical protein [Leifsonia virtsii]MDN4598834.1 hypothetical protein [Leifsonia virtsii]